MITHGSQIITDLRRGTWQITSMTMGTFDILGKFSSPYSTAATVALQAAFPTQWETIRLYGIAHPEIVGYMNAYAVEDPKIAYSLVEGIGSRKIIGPNNASNYFTLPWCNTNKTEIEIEFEVERTDNWVLLSTYQTRIFALSSNTYAGWGTDRMQYSYPYAIGTKYVGLFNSTSLKVNGVNIGRIGSSYGSNKMYVGHDYQNSSIANNIDIISLKWKEDGVRVGWFVPFVRDDKVELMNLITGELATRTGSFTISETPSS